MAGKIEDPATDILLLALAKRVTELREARGWTAPDFAKRAGMNPNYLWRIETGKQNLSFRNVARLANALGLTLAELLGPIDASALELTTRPYTRSDRRQRTTKR